MAGLDGFSREDVDRYACQSQQRAAHAQDNGYFAKSLVPVKDLNGVTILGHDELIRPTTMEGLAKLKPSFGLFNDYGHGDFLKFKYPQVEQVECIHTPGNSSGVVDGASLVLLGNAKAGADQGIKPRARIVSCALTGTEPTIMLAGPAPAAQKALKLANMTVDDIDLFELNEAFASVVLRFQQLMGVGDEKINVNGGAIAMGHPIGATGAMVLGAVLDELERRDLNTALVTLCAGGGIGIATIIERV
jgi:acetyl-CoA C-acetyltransferase